jgi:HYR domain/Secretion system C-terminal sorting domain
MKFPRSRSITKIPTRFKITLIFQKIETDMKSSIFTLSLLFVLCSQMATAQTCPNNLLLNPGFENSLSNWEGPGVISTVASAGAQSVKLCQNGNLRQTNATTSGKNLTLSFKARTETTGANTVLAYIKYLNSSWSPIVTEFYSLNTTATYTQGTVSKASPTGTAWVEVGFLKSNTGCVLIDEVCFSENGGSNNCSTDLGPGDLLCTEKSGANLIVRKILNGSVTATTVSGAGAIVTSVNEGPLVHDSVLVTGNQVRKKLANGTIAWTRTIPQSILDSLNTVQAAAELSNGQLLLGGFRKPANGGLPPSVGILTLVKTTSAVVPITFKRINTNTSFNDPGVGFFDRFFMINPRTDGGADIAFTYMFPGIVNFESLNITRVNSALTVTIPTIQIAGHAGFYPAATTKIYRTTCGSYFFDLPIYTAAQKGSSQGRQRLYLQQSDLKQVSKFEGGTGNVDQFGSFNFSNFLAASPDSLTGAYLYRPGVDPVPPFAFRLVNSATDTVIVQTPIDAYVHAARIGAGLFLFSKNANGSLVVNIPTNCGATITCSPDVTPPVIVNCPPSQNVPTTGTSATVSYTMPTATDACSAATLTTNIPQNAAIYPLGTTTVNVFATDAANNVATCTFTITVTSVQQGGCSNNLLQNAGFESNFANWDGTGGVIVTNAAAGLKSAKLCQNMSLRQTLATTSGKTLTLTFKARGETTATNVVAYIKYLNSAWTPLVTEFFGYAAGTSFGQGTVSKLAPTGTAYVEIGFLQNASSCVLIDEVCLTDGVVPPACALTTVSGPVVCDNANTPTNPADDTFSGSITVSNTGNCGVGWTSNAIPASGGFGTTVGFGPYLISGGNKTITFAAAGDSSKTASITLVAPSTCSNAVPLPDVVSKRCLDFIGFSTGLNLPIGTVAAAGTVSFQSCAQTVTNLIAPNTSITFKNKIYISPANFLTADAMLLVEETVTTNLTSPCGQNCFYTENPYSSGNIPAGLTPGTYFMISVSDADNQISEASETNNVYVQSVNVVSAANSCSPDVTPPVLTPCPSSILSIVLTHGATPNWTLPTATDNCAGAVTVTGTHAPFQLFSLGVTTVTYTARDAANNTATCTFTVTVQQQGGNPCNPDVTPPVLTPCPSNILSIVLTHPAAPQWTPPTATDNCAGPVTVTSTHTPGQLFQTGVTTVTYTARDANQNSATCTFTVTVQQQGGNPCNPDVTPPVITCPANVTATANAATGTVVTWSGLNVSDNCGPVPSLNGTKNSGDQFPVGVTTVTYLAGDLSSNTATCSFTVTVVLTGTCPNNRITANPGFELQQGGWNADGAITIVTDKYAGSHAYSLCGPASGGRVYQTFTATAGANHTFSLFAKVTGGGSGAIFIKYLNSSWSPIAQEFQAFSAATYTQVTKSLVAPTGTAYIEVGALRTGAAGCILLDEACLTSTTAVGLQSSSAYVAPEPFSAVTIFPNPASEQVHIDLTAECIDAPCQSATQIDILSAFGKFQFSASASQPVFDLNVSDWESGVYHVSLRREGERARVMKLVVVKM